MKSSNKSIRINGKSVEVTDEVYRLAARLRSVEISEGTDFCKPFK